MKSDQCRTPACLLAPRYSHKPRGCNPSWCVHKPHLLLTTKRLSCLGSKADSQVAVKSLYSIALGPPSWLFSLGSPSQAHLLVHDILPVCYLNGPVSAQVPGWFLPSPSHPSTPTEAPDSHPPILPCFIGGGPASRPPAPWPPSCSHLLLQLSSCTWMWVPELPWDGRALYKVTHLPPALEPRQKSTGCSNLALPLTGCVILGKSFGFPAPQFLYKMG